MNTKPLYNMKFFIPWVESTSFESHPDSSSPSIEETSKGVPGHAILLHERSHQCSIMEHNNFAKMRAKTHLTMDQLVMHYKVHVQSIKSCTSVPWQ